MERSNLPKKDPLFDLGKVGFELVLSEDGSPLTLISQPFNDLAEINNLRGMKFSLKKSLSDKPLLIDFLRNEFDSLKGKSKRHRGSTKYLNRMASLLDELGEFDAAANYMRDALLIEDSSYLENKYADLLIKNNKYQQGREIFESLAKSGDPYALLRMASLYVMGNDFKKAGFLVREAIDINPEGYAGRLFQGALCIASGDYKKAIGYLRIAVHDRPGSSYVYSNLGMAYFAINRLDKAFQSLGKAIAFDPFNANALIMYSDVAHSLDKDGEAIDHLKKYVEFEQTNAAVWGRLARSLVSFGMYDDCIYALKAQGAVEETPAIWNNIGIAYANNKDYEKCFSSFKYALRLASDKNYYESLIIARNIIHQYAKINKSDNVISVAETLINDANLHALIISDSNLSDIYIFYLHALLKKRKGEIASALAEELLSQPIPDSLGFMLVSNLVSYHSLEHFNEERLRYFLDSGEVYIPKLRKENLLRLCNNFAFAYVELGDFKKASRFISKVSTYLHKDAYLTATLGLLCIRRGDYKRGELLYREAISLSKNHADKSRIRQKLNLELGRRYIGKSPRRAARFFTKVISEKHGESALIRQAMTLIDEK